jgi:hypothetical protein
MAIRKFIFFNGTEGYSQEQATNDELSLGKVTLSGVSGVSLDVGGGDIANLGAPTGANSAARKAYVDSGLATEAAARAADVATVTAAITAEATARANADTTLQGNITAEASARTSADAALQAEIDAEEIARAGAVTTLTSSLSAEQAARIAADTALQSGLSAEATARTNADTALQAEIDAEEVARAAAVTTLTNNLSAEQAARIAADNLLATNYAAADSALSASLTSAYQAADAQVVSQMQAYADSLQAGFSIKAPVMAIATGNITLSGAQTVDGVSLVAGNRVLVAGQTSGADNGIYVVASGAWARSADADSSSEVKDGMSVFVEQGTTYGDSTWVLVTNNAIALGSTALTFVQFSGLGQITAGAGLSKTGNELSVNVGNGLAIVADSVKVSLSEVSGLEFHANGGLEIKSNPTKGIFVDNDGIYLGVKQPFEFNDNQLDLRLASADRLAVANGNLDVTGLPLQFKINGAAASTSVTASALTALTGNGGGDNYHWHAKLRSYLLASESIANVGTAVYVSGSGTVGSASCSTAATARVIGLAIGSATTGGAVTYVMHGVHQFSGRTFAPGTAYYLGANGLPVEYSALGSGDRVVRVGYGVTGDTMQVAIQDIGQKA